MDMESLTLTTVMSLFADHFESWPTVTEALGVLSSTHDLRQRPLIRTASASAQGLFNYPASDKVVRIALAGQALGLKLEQ